MLWCAFAAIGIGWTRRALWTASATFGARFATFFALSAGATFSTVAALGAALAALSASAALATVGSIAALAIAGRTIGARLLSRALLGCAHAGSASRGLLVQRFALCIKALALACTGTLATS